MGAATAIMYGATDPSIGGMVLDSPFSSLPKLAQELVTSDEVRYLPPLPLSPLLIRSDGVVADSNPPDGI